WYGPRPILQVHQNHIDPRLLQRSNPLVDGTAEIIGIDPPDSIVGASLPDNQSRVFCLHHLNEGGGDVLGGLATLYFYGEIDRHRPELLLEHRQKPRRIGATLLRGDGRRTAAYHQDIQRFAAFDG